MQFPGCHVSALGTPIYSRSWSQHGTLTGGPTAPPNRSWCPPKQPLGASCPATMAPGLRRSNPAHGKNGRGRKIPPTAENSLCVSKCCTKTPSPCMSNCLRTAGNCSILIEQLLIATFLALCFYGDSTTAHLLTRNYAIMNAISDLLPAFDKL